ncbi:MAG: hypothetical protein A2252_00345 [Elusimicrobia bacterium RIFOXYA2_FULL_39_19]|nr:MAG: hypothetical protein A2252_00345 [Elusimicrobia bacterium RIFOXYA2_FULL_39_19]
MIKNIFKISILVCLITAGNLFSAGTTGFNFLKIGVGARPVGMGGAFAGLSDDINSIYWNPAGLAQLKNREMTAAYLSWLEGINSQYLAYAGPLKDNKGVIGVSINSLTSGAINKYDISGTLNGSTSAGAMAIGVTYAKGELMKGSKNLSGGITIKMVQETLADKSISVPVVDLGLLSKKAFSNNKMSLGVNIQNLGSGVKYINEVDPLPQNIKVGIGYKTNEKTMVCVDYNVPNDNAGYINAGVEYKLNEMINLRAGYKTGTDIDMGVRAGFGIFKNNVGIDYAYAGYGDLGITHRVSLNYMLGIVEKEKSNVKKVKKVKAKKEEVKQTEIKTETKKVEDNSEKIDKLCKKAELYYTRGKMKESLEVLQEVLKIDSTNKRARDLFIKISMQKK